MQMESRSDLTAEEAALRARVAQRMALLDGLDPVIHQPTRLRLMALLAQSQGALRFQTLAELLHLLASNLSIHLTILARAGFIIIQKAASGRYAVTSIELTPAGRAAFVRYRTAMRSLLAVDELEGAPER